MRFTILDLVRPDDFHVRHIHKVKHVQLKANGLRVLVTKSRVSGEVLIKAETREGKTDFWPQLSRITSLRERVETLPDWTALDCELHVPGMAETSVKTLVIAGDSKLILTPFAIPVFGGEDQRLADLVTINKIITSLGFEPPETRSGLLSTGDVETLLESARQRSIEGWVLKAGHYQGWWKLKPVRSVDCVVLGVERGEGKHAGRLGAINVGLYDEDGNLPTPALFSGNSRIPAKGWQTKVGTGFTDVERQHIWDNPDSVLGKVVEIEYDSLAANGALKFPRFKRFRDDKEPHECLASQIQPK